MSSRGLKNTVAKRFWKAGLTPVFPHQQRQELRLTEYPQWRIRCHQSRQWFLWTLFDDAKAESPDPSGYFALITVDRRNDSALATFELALLEAWLAARTPFVIPRRKRRVGFAHHSLLESLGHAQGLTPLLVSRQHGKPLLVSVPLQVFKQWLAHFPAPHDPARHTGEQMALMLWHLPRL